MNDQKKRSIAVEESSEIKLLKLMIDQTRDIAEEAKKIALDSRHRQCLKEAELTHITETMQDTKEAIGKINDTNTRFSEELVKWKWFRMLLVPITIAAISTAAGAFMSFTNVRKDVETAVIQQNKVQQEINTVRQSQTEMMNLVIKREKETEKYNMGMEDISKKLDEIAEQTKKNEIR